MKGKKGIQIQPCLRYLSFFNTHKTTATFDIYISFFRMKLTAVFLVLSMVVLMAEPADGFNGWLIKGAIHGILELFCLLLALI